MHAVKLYMVMACASLLWTMASGQTSWSYREQAGISCEKHRVLTNHLLAVHSGIQSRLKCLARCYAAPGCQSINYAHGTRECQLSGSKIAAVSEGDYMESQEFDYCGPEGHIEWERSPKTIELPSTEAASTADIMVHETCGHHLGMENGNIPDSRITASSTYNGCHTSYGRLNYNVGTPLSAWCSASDDKEAPWFQVDLTAQMQVEGVIMQGSYHGRSYDEWVTAYQVQYSDDGNSWQYVTLTSSLTAQTFSGNTDETTPVTSMFDQPIQARYIRIRPTAYHEWPSMRIELIGCKAPDCNTLATYRQQSGVYVIYPTAVGLDTLNVYCDISEDGGWIVIQRRQDGSVDFNRNWADYEAGFGDLESEFWLGNSNIKALTSAGTWRLRVDLLDWDRETAWAEYDSFSLTGSTYTLILGNYSGNATDSLSYHANHQFSTIDQDNDGGTEKVSCAEVSNSGWWFDYCLKANLNGVYFETNPVGFNQGLQWDGWKNNYYSIKGSVMKIQQI